MLKRRGPDARLNLSSNELLHPEANRLVRSVLGRLDCSTVCRYPVTRRAIDGMCEFLALSPQELWLTPGSDIALRTVVATYASQSNGTDRLLLQHPNYPAWEEAARAYALPVEEVALEQAGPEAQAAALLKAARATRSCLIAVSVPNGPGGWALDEATLDLLTEAAAERGHLLVIDACYQAFNGPLTSHLRRRSDNVLVVQSMSKSHGLPGARIGLVSGAAERIASLGDTQLEQCVSGMTVQLAYQLLTESDQFAPIWRELVQVRERVTAELRDFGLSPLPSGGNFVTLPVGSAAAAGEVVEVMSREGYRIRDLSTITGLTGCVRFTIADEDTTERAARSLFEALARVEAGREKVNS
jgi:histidinol-phosphate aminotransferase